MKTSKYFKVGENNFSYTNSIFTELFGDMNFVEVANIHLETRKLPRSMNNKEILAELKPEEVTLGDLVFFLKTASKSEWYLCYIKDSTGVLWAVLVDWDGGGWNVVARSVEHPDDWRGGRQVFSRRFFDSTPLTLNPSDTLTLAIEEVKKAGYKIIKEI